MDTHLDTKAANRPETPHRILIVGGGAGGLELATRLGRKMNPSKVEVVLIDSSLTHLWKPLLHEVAAGSLDSGNTEIDYLAHARNHGFQFHLGTMDSLDRQQRLVWLQAMCDDEGQLLAGRRSLYYDTLVMAIGSQVNDFHTPGVRQHALLLNSVADARRLHKRLFAICLRFNEGVTRTNDIAVIGGGATGVELVAELHDALQTFERYASASEPLRVGITLIEASGHILSHLSDEVRDKVLRDLNNKGIRVMAGKAVEEVMADGVRLAGGETLPAGLVVWAAGVKAPDWLSQLDGLASNGLNQLLVTPSLQSTVDTRVFAMGDCAACTPPGRDKPIAPLAQAAHQQAAYLARVLPQHVRGRQSLRPFQFHDHGSLISLGMRKAVGSFNGSWSGHRFFVNGFVARWSYRALYQGYLMALHGWIRTGLAALGNLLTHTTKARVKLH